MRSSLLVALLAAGCIAEDEGTGACPAACVLLDGACVYAGGVPVPCLTPDAWTASGGAVVTDGTATLAPPSGVDCEPDEGVLASVASTMTLPPVAERGRLAFVVEPNGLDCGGNCELTLHLGAQRADARVCIADAVSGATALRLEVRAPHFDSGCFDIEPITSMRVVEDDTCPDALLDDPSFDGSGAWTLAPSSGTAGIVDGALRLTAPLEACGENLAFQPIALPLDVNALRFTTQHSGAQPRVVLRALGSRDLVTSVLATPSSSPAPQTHCLPDDAIGMLGELVLTLGDACFCEPGLGCEGEGEGGPTPPPFAEATFDDVALTFDPACD